MAISGKALLDASTGRLLSTHLPTTPTFEDVTLSNGTALNHGIVGMVSGINALNLGSVNLITVPSGVSLMVTKFVFALTSVNSISGTLEVGCGTDVVAENIMPSQALTGFNTAGATWFHNVSGNRVMAGPTETLKLGIDVEFTGTTASMICVVFGVYVPA